MMLQDLYTTLFTIQLMEHNLATEQNGRNMILKFVKRKVAFYALLIRIPSFVLKLIFEEEV